MIMGQMFCTLEQAADRLGVTEPEVREMVDGGVLREFRDGTTLLLQAADVETLATSRGPAEVQPAAAEIQAPSPKTPATQTRQTKPRSPRPAKEPSSSGMSAQAAPGRGTAARKKGTSRRSGTTRASSKSKDSELEDVLSPPGSPLMDQPLYPVAASASWPGLQMERPSAWRRLCTGVAQDRPGAILALSLVLAAIVAIIAVGVYLVL
jgi:excisionase family DNA binding protein